MAKSNTKKKDIRPSPTLRRKIFHTPLKSLPGTSHPFPTWSITIIGLPEQLKVCAAFKFYG